MSHYFPKLLSFEANFGNFGIRLMKLGLFLHQFKKILKIWSMFIPVFALNRDVSWPEAKMLEKSEKVCESGLKASKTGWKEIKVQEFGLHESRNSCKSRKTYIPDWIRDHRYTCRRLILSPISATRPRIDLCTKNPPPLRGIVRMSNVGYHGLLSPIPRTRTSRTTV